MLYRWTIVDVDQPLVESPPAMDLIVNRIESFERN